MTDTTQRETAATPPSGPVVAIVPAFERADSVAATVAALQRLDRVQRVVVVDDASGDGTADAAAAAGAEVLVLPRNVGKAGAVLAGVEATPEAGTYLLIDADVVETAAAANVLLDPVLDGRADMTIGVLPPAEGRGGFGTIKRLAAWGTRRGGGWTATAPLSGQRAARAEALRGLHSAERFGLEVALNIDVARDGGTVLEVPVPMDHRHTGRSIAGFAHRGRQGADILRAMWPRLVGRRLRNGLTIAVTVALAVMMLAVSSALIPSSVPADAPAERVVVVGIPGWSLDDIESGATPHLDRIGRSGAMAAMSVRTAAGRARTVEAYATIGAGTRVSVSGADGLRRDAPFEGSTAAEVVARRTGAAPTGEVVVPAIGSAIEHAGSDRSSDPGALGDALAAGGVSTAVVGNADTRNHDGEALDSRPTAVALTSSFGSVDLGVVDRSLLTEDPAAPYGLRSDHAAVLAATAEVLAAGAGVVVVDPGDTDRALRYAPSVSEKRAEELRLDAMTRTDEFVGDLAARLDEDTLLMVVGLTPPTRSWELTPVLVSGPGVTSGYLHSNSTKREGLITLTDLAPTILSSLDLETPDGMIGVPLRYRSGTVDVDALREQNDTATGREGVYYPMALLFIVVQALGYVVAVLVLSRGNPRGPTGTFLRLMVLSFAAWPLVTFALRAVPGIYDLGAGVQGVAVGASIAVAALASRARRHPLSPMLWICGATVVTLVVDVATGANLQMSSILGYSPHTAARFVGYGNTAFAVLAATAVLWAAMHVHYAPRRRDAWLTVACVLFLVVLADGAPTLGSDVGGILTLVPVFGLVLYVMTGRRLDLKTVVIAGVATGAIVAAVAGLDLLRGEGNRTHLGDFVAGAFEGDGTFWTTISRKWATNVRVFQQTIWTWMVPITAGFLTYVLVVSSGWRRLLPERSPLRAGILGCLAAGVLGWLVNDSGVVVTALVFVYAGPYLTLLALDSDSAPVLRPPASTPPT